MAMGLNKVFLIGNIGSDPSLKFTPKGTPMVVLNLYQTEYWKDKNTGEKKENSHRHRIILFNNVAELASNYLKRGSRIHITGKLNTRSWVNKEGREQYITEVFVQEILLLDNKNDSLKSDEKVTKEEPPLPENSDIEENEIIL